MRIAAGIHQLADAIYTPTQNDLPTRGTRMSNERLYQDQAPAKKAGNGNGAKKTPAKKAGGRS
jgi:hypothetical protein